MWKDFIACVEHVRTSRFAWLALLITLVLLVPDIAFAEDQALPYEAGLGNFKRTMVGPVPFVISLVGVVGCGAMLIFGGEISGFMRTMVFIILVVAVIVQATSVVNMLGGNYSGDAKPGLLLHMPFTNL